MHTTLAVLLSFLPAAGFDPDFATLFTPKTYSYTGGVYKARTFKYQLLIPDTSDLADKRPLIVWLHGMGEAGDDNIRQLLWLGHTVLQPPWKRGRYPFFLLAVQCPTDNPGWSSKDPRQRHAEMLDVLTAILDATIADYPIDRGRVYLTGISSGGTACWKLAAKHPTYFAAVAPMASKGSNSPTRIRRLVKMPIWAFHCDQDNAMPIRFVRDTVIDLRRAGCNVHLTEIESTEHDCWTPAFRDYFLLDWLLAQRRGGPIWQWWQLPLQLLVFVFPVAVFYSVRHCVRSWTARGSA